MPHSPPPAAPRATPRVARPDDVFATAEARARATGGRLTPLRRQVLAVLADADQPLSAYQLLDRMAQAELGARRPLPMQVYRSLDFLHALGLAHKVESISAWVLCRHPDGCALGQFLICRRCQRVVELELPALDRAGAEAAQAHGFLTSGLVIEVSGLCQACHAAPAGTPAPGDGGADAPPSRAPRPS